MVKAVRIYVEGGGQGKNSRLQFRHGFNEFLRELRDMARRKRIKWDLVACGSRNAAYNDFINNNSVSDADSAVVLFVDSEGPVDAEAPPVQHLQRGDKWEMQTCDNERCHLMVQLMEAWFLGDIDALEGYYGENFNRNAIPRRNNVEEVPKRDVLQALERATQQASKGPYSKGRHSHEILKLIGPTRVRSKAPYCARLFDTVAKSMDEQI